MQQEYGGPDHGQAVVITLDDAIRYLLSVHTVQTIDGKLDVITGAGPRETENAEPLCRESWNILRRAVTDYAKAPLNGIDVAWIRAAEDRISIASVVTLDRDQFRALLAIARNGLRPKPV